VVELQEFSSVLTTWNVITGPYMTLDTVATKVTLSTSNLALDVSPTQVTTNYKIVAYSTAPDSPKHEVLLDITWEHPCRTATFTDPALAVADMTSFVDNPVAVTQPIDLFTITPTLDCGAQTYEIVYKDVDLGGFKLSDFLTINASNELVLSPDNTLHEGVYNVELEVTFATHALTHTSVPFELTVLKPCDEAIINLEWDGVTSPQAHTYVIQDPAVPEYFAYTVALGTDHLHCTLQYEL